MPEAAPAATVTQLRRELGLADLVLFNISALVGIRWLAAAAHAGPGSVTLWALAAAGYFIPCALVVSTLSAKWPAEGGLYVWTRHSFGDWHAFLCGWLYWLSNLFFLPSVLLVGVSVASYALGPSWASLAESGPHVLPVTLLILWIAVLTNVLGLRTGKWTSNFGGAATYLAGGLIIAAGLLAWMKDGAVTPLDLTPEWNWEKVNLWSQIAFAFTGLELGPVMAEEIRDPQRSVPRAAWVSAIAVTAFYIFGTVAILVLLRPEEVSVVTGLAETGAAAGRRLGYTWMTSVIAVLVALGITGQVGTWMAGNARLPMVFGVDRYLPRAFGRIHPRWRTPHVALIAQGILCTVFLIAMQAGETMRAGYQLLVDMAVLTAFIPFLYIFAAGFREKRYLAGAIGFLVSLFAAGLSLVPPGGTSSVLIFELKIAGGWFLLALVARVIFLRGPAR